MSVSVQQKFGVLFQHHSLYIASRASQVNLRTCLFTEEEDYAMWIRTNKYIVSEEDS